MPRFKETKYAQGVHVGSCRYLRWRSHTLHTIMYIIEYRETDIRQLSTIIICRCARPLKLFKQTVHLSTNLFVVYCILFAVVFIQLSIDISLYHSCSSFFLSWFTHELTIHVFISLYIYIYRYKIFFCIYLSQISLSQESHVCLYYIYILLVRSVLYRTR